MRQKHLLTAIREHCLAGTMTFTEWLLYAIALILPSVGRYRRLEDRLVRTLWRYQVLKKQFTEIQYWTETTVLAGLLNGHQAQERFVGQTEAILMTRRVSIPIIMANLKIDSLFDQNNHRVVNIDEIVRLVALEIRNSLRRSDILWSDDSTGKFSVILTGLDRDASTAILKSLQARIRENGALIDAGVTLLIGASMKFVDPNDDLEEVFRGLSIEAIGAMCLARRKEQRGFAFTPQTQ